MGRLQLQSVLEGLLGSTNVYFQPPASVQMQYPAIVYKRNRLATQFAGNFPYRLKQRYEITVIDRNPDSLIPAKVAALPQCVSDRFFVVDNLNHDVFTIYF